MHDACGKRRCSWGPPDYGGGGGAGGHDRSGNLGLLGRPPGRGRGGWDGEGGDGGWGDGDDGPPSGIAILAFLGAVALAIIGGYFLVMKLIEISHREDCLLAGGRWTGAYYLGGYAVECGLKACILARVGATPEIIFDEWIRARW